MSQNIDTTNNLFQILKRRKIMVLGLFLLILGSGLFGIQNTPPSTAHNNASGQKSLPAPSILSTQEYINVKAKYIFLKTKLSSFINKDDGINLHKNNKALEKLSSAALDTLLDNQREHNYALETLSLRYGEKHPKIIRTKQKISAINAQIDAEREALLGKLIDEYILAKTTFDALETNQSTSKLQQEQKATKSQPPYAHTILYNRHLIGAIMLIALLFAIIIPVIIEKSRNTFISGRELSSFFKLPCYALIPWTKCEKGRTLADYPIDNPADPLSEALHSLRININLAQKENKIVLVSSSENGEGKTMLCTWLARMAAKSNQRVLLIDANLRNPCLHKALNAKNTMSLIEYLTDKADLKTVTDTAANPSGLHAIYARPTPNSVIDLISSPKMSDLLTDIRQSYDLIIIDTPSCLENADARALAPCADLLLYLVGWNKTKRNVIHRGLSQFLQFTHISTALVLSNIDLKKYTQYGFGKIIFEEDE